MTRFRLWFAALLLFSSQLLANTVWVVPVKGPIGPAVSDYLSREIAEAEAQGVSMVVLKMDTPGVSIARCAISSALSPPPASLWRHGLALLARELLVRAPISSSPAILQPC